MDTSNDLAICYRALAFIWLKLKRFTPVVLKLFHWFWLEYASLTVAVLLRSHTHTHTHTHTHAHTHTHTHTHTPGREQKSHALPPTPTPTQPPHYTSPSHHHSSIHQQFGEDFLIRGREASAELALNDRFTTYGSQDLQIWWRLGDTYPTYTSRMGDGPTCTSTSRPATQTLYLPHITPQPCTYRI